MDLIQIIDNYGGIYRDRAAHVYRESSLAYEALKEKSDALACYLIDTYGDDKTPVVVYGHKQHEMLVCFLACVKAGHAYIPVDISLPAQRVLDIIESSQTRLILAVSAPGQTIAGNILGLDAMHAIIDANIGRIPSVSYRVKQDDTYYIIYTSGSTGQPKGVQITLANLESFVRWGLGLCGLESVPASSAVFLNQAPFSFDLSVMDLYLALASGSTLYSIDKTMIANLRELFAYLGRSAVSVWVSTPSFAEMCLADSHFDENLLPDLRLLLFCGETLSNSCARKLYERFPQAKVINSYGPTEATVAVTALHVDRTMCDTIEPLPVGYVKQDCRILIVSPDGRAVQDGGRGEIVIVGDSVSTGYYRNEEMTAKAFAQRVLENSVAKRSYRTGDEGYLQDGLLYYCGRIDFQIKLNGYRIELEDIENNIRKLGYVANAVVLPVRKDDKVQYLAAVVVLNTTFDQKEFETGQMIKHNLKALLPEYMIPRKIVFRDSIPMTVNGKVNRAVLMEAIP